MGQEYDYAPYSYAGLLGDGQVVGIADTGIDRNSCYFYDSDNGDGVPVSDISDPVTDLNARKIVQYTNEQDCGDNTDEYEGHGTHVSGIVVGSIGDGDLLSDTGKFSGVAPNAKVAFVDVATPGSGLYIPSTSDALYTPSYSAGARVHTNSWGSLYTTGSYYSAADVDQYLVDHMDSTIIFSAGNNGQDDGGNGYASCSMESQGKNVIAVGSSETTLDSYDINYIAWYSSKGPAADGRIKPDLVGPGDSLMSALASGTDGQTCDTIAMTGTSMAAPAVAGAALLVRQYFSDNSDGSPFWKSTCSSSQYANCMSDDGFTPSGVLVKAVLIHSGSTMTLYDGGGGDLDVSLGPNTPDFTQGFGRVTLSNVLPISTDLATYSFDLFVDDLKQIDEDSTINYYVNVQSFTSPLK